MPASNRLLVIACGALVPEIQAIRALNHLDSLDIRAAPASLHNRPERIVPAIARLVRAARKQYARIFIAYADCGTGGALDRFIQAEGLERLPGAHCYAFFSGVDAFAARADEDMTSFFLTDFLARHFETLVWQGLGLDRHPELRDAYFGNYRKLVYLSQAATPDLLARAVAAGARLGLPLEHRPVGYGDLAHSLVKAARP